VRNNEKSFYTEDRTLPSFKKNQKKIPQNFAYLKINELLCGAIKILYFFRVVIASLSDFSEQIS
jgi:hypothetical protein